MEVNIETKESVVLRGSRDRRSTLKWCPICGRRVEMVNPEQVARIVGFTTRTIYRWIEAEGVHFTETSRNIRVCLTSL